MKVGYARVSSVGQNLESQIRILEEYGCEKIFQEKKSGRSMKERDQLQDMLTYVREGDEVVVFSIDRLARNLRDLQSIIQQLNNNGVTVRFLSERLVFTANTNDAFAKLQLQLMGAFAEFERNIIRKRQLEGIEKAKAKGVYANRGTTICRDRVKELKADGLSNSAIARTLEISRMSVYRVLK